MTAELILGTAQLGSAYGINNKEGDLSQEAAFAVLDTAYESGVRILDTAERYGSSEAVIGEYIKVTNRAFRVCTKLSDLPDDASGHLFEFVTAHLERSLAKLSVDSIYTYYLHDFAMCRNKDLLGSLCKLKSRGFIESLGVSIYEPEELRFIIDETPDLIDVVQIPFNVLNCGCWLEGGLLDKAVSRGIRLAARSVYVQGLIFRDAQDTFVQQLGLEDAICDLRKTMEVQKVDMDAVACDFVRSIPGISWIILGSETPAQVQHNAGIFKSANPWTKEMVRAQIKSSERVSPMQVDPRFWK